MKKIISLLLSFVMLICMFATVNAANELATAKSYSLGTLQNGSITESNKANAYKFTLPSSGTINIEIEADFEYIYYEIYDENGTSMYSHCEHWNSTLETLKYGKSLDLARGTYYISFKGIHPGFSGEYFGEYKFNIDFESAEETFDDKQNGSNNTIKEANKVDFSNQYIGHIALNDKKDIYQFELKSSSKVKLSFEGKLEYLYAKIYNTNGDEIWNHCEHWNGTMNYLNCEKEMELMCGTYYISFEGIHPGFSGEYFGEYKFNIDFESANETFDDKLGDTNNAINEASNININQKYNGHIAINDKKDIYRFELKSSSKVKLAFEGELEYLYAKIYNANGDEVWNHCEHWNGTLNYLSCEKEIELMIGTYYISFEGIHPGFSGEYFGKYSFYVSDGGSINTTNSSGQIPDSGSNDEPIPSGFKTSDWAKAEVEEAGNLGLIPDGLMKEDLTQKINRAEFAAISVKMYEKLSGKKASTGSNPFIDISENTYESDIIKAYNLGVTLGMGSDKFNPDTNITREQMATMLTRAYKKSKYSDWSVFNDSKYSLDISGVVRFNDDKQISAYAREAVYFMAGKYIINGVGNNYFAPKRDLSKDESYGYATREQALAIALRSVKVLK